MRVHTEATPPLKLVLLPETDAVAGPSIAGPSALPSLANSIQSAPNQREFLESLKALASVLNNGATSSSFFEPVAEAMVRMIELYSGRVLLLENGE